LYPLGGEKADRLPERERGQVKFGDAENSAPFPSEVVTTKKANLISIVQV